MKRQSFHQRKIRIQETPNLDLGELKARTINALNKLGQQRFSTEPGGYAFESWIRGVNFLLDGFEEKAGAGRLSPEYLARRRELSDRLSRPIATSSLDEDVAELRAGISDIERRVEAERGLMVSKISELKAEQTSNSAELERERRRVAGAAEAQGADSFIGRLLGRSKVPAGDPEDRTKEFESRVALLSQEVLEKQRQLKMVDRRSPESPLAGEWKRLESMQNRLKELEEERLDRVQMVKERAEYTASMADAVSMIPQGEG